MPVILTLLGSVIAVEWLFGSQITSQFSLLAKDLPESFAQLACEFASSPWGAWLLGHAQDMNLSSATGPVAGYIAAVFGSVFRTGAYVSVLFFAAMYFAIAGALRLACCGSYRWTVGYELKKYWIFLGRP